MVFAKRRGAMQLLHTKDHNYPIAHCIKILGSWQPFHTEIVIRIANLAANLPGNQRDVGHVWLETIRKGPPGALRPGSLGAS